MSEGLISLDELDVVAEKFTAQLCDVMMQVIGRPLELSSIITQGKKKHRRNRKRPTYQQIIKDFHR